MCEISPTYVGGVTTLEDKETKEVVKVEPGTYRMEIGTTLIPQYGLLDLSRIGKCSYLYGPLGSTTKKITCRVLAQGLMATVPWGLYPYPLPEGTKIEKLCKVLVIMTVDTELRLRVTELQTVRKSGAISVKRSCKDLLEYGSVGACFITKTEGEGKERKIRVDPDVPDGDMAKLMEAFVYMKKSIRGVVFASIEGGPWIANTEEVKMTSILEEED